ncbi:MAG: hypothetical protein BGO72_00010 [Burkholderiales bacterium 70-64]|nr:MAG: hypothetical protein BGO72_00010 [Burkholderiales bacterium 70-64]
MPAMVAFCPRCHRSNRPAAAFCDGCGAPLDAGARASPRQAAPHAEPFIGRERELASFDAALAEALDMEGRLLVLAGDPGIGKTRTAQALAQRAQAQGLRVLWGRCPEEPGSPPYWPWLQVLRAWLGTLEDDAQLRAVLGHAASHLAEIVPEIAARCPGLPAVAATADAAQARFRLFDAIAGVLARIAAERGLVLILDDLHWADTPSLRLLEFLAPEIGTRRMLVLGTYRDIALARHHPLSDTLGTLARHPRFTRLRLLGLSLEETGRFIAEASGAAPSPELLAAVHAQTEGNPLFVAETTRFLVQEGVLGGDAAPSSPARGARLPRRIPEGVREAIGSRLNRLSPACNRVLACAAVIGRSFDTRVLARLLDGTPQEEWSAALDEALAASIIEALAEPGAWQFSHVLIRETLYDEVPATRRARLHLAIGAILETLHGGDPMAEVATLAHHYCAALPAGDPARAIEYARRAARRADALFAWEEAARYYRLALQALDDADPGAARERLGLLIALGSALTRAGEDLEAAEILQRTAGSARTLGLSEELARAACGFEEATWRPGLPGHAAARLLHDALAGLDEGDSVLKVEVLSSLTRALIFSGDSEAAARFGAQAEAMARRIGDPRALSTALRAGLSARWRPEQFERRMATTLEAMRLAEQVGDRDRALEASSWRLFDLMELGDLQQRAEEFRAYAEAASATRQPFYHYICLSSHAMLALFHGRFEQAEQHAREALEFGRRMPSLDAAGVFGLQMFSLRREQGRLKELAPLVAHFVQATPAAAAWRPGLAIVYAEIGMTEQARAQFELLAADGFAAVPRDALWVASMAYLAEVCALLGDAPRAGQLYEFLLPCEGRNIVAPPNVACYGAAARQLGMLAATCRRWAQAQQHFEAALQANTRQEGWPWLAHTQHQYAAMLLARAQPGDGARAAGLLDEAIASSRTLGMPALGERAAVLRARLGEREPGGEPRPAGLSVREIEVLRLVATGKGNREIARQLFVSPNTVANHVRSILTKTRTANRTEAAAFALRHLPRS